MAEDTDSSPAGNEPSMEEILASIRTIISDDNAPSDAAAPAEDVIDLTQMMQDDGSIVDLTAESAAEERGMEIEEATPGLIQSFDPVVPAASMPAPEEPILSEPVMSAAISSMAALANTVEIERLASAPSSATYMGNGARTLEDMVLELMRPMLKDWLDKNLPAAVDRIVQKEVERISRRAKD